MVCVERRFTEDGTEERDGHVLRALLDCLTSLWKSCRCMGKQRFADVLVHHNPRIRVGASLAYLVYAPIPLFEDESGQLRLGVRGVAYEPFRVKPSEQVARAR